MNGNAVLAIGLMSGTSMDGVDAAMIATDGENVSWVGPALTIPYEDAFRERLRAALGVDPVIRVPANDLEKRLTILHVEAVHALLAVAERSADDIRVIGFHGHTVLHRPDLGVTRQIGDATLLARETGIDVIADFRQNDIVHGGEGAPLAPIYHRAKAKELDKPIAILNLGGVGNVTWIGDGADDVDDDLLAFDTGPGNALIDDWVRDKTGATMDRDGELAAQGKVDDGVLKALLDNAYFNRLPPKSLDRNEFPMGLVHPLSVPSGAATLAAFTVQSVARAMSHLPRPPRRWLVTGGGRHNPGIMAGLRTVLGVPVDPVEAEGWNGDALEAEAFAYLAVRSLKDLALSYPHTTGVAEPVTGGRFFPASMSGSTD